VILSRTGERHRKDLGDIDALMASIREVGLLHPIVIRKDRTLVAGWRRLTAAARLGRVSVPVHVVANLDDTARLLKAERDENLHRKDLTPSEAVALGKALEELERAGAKKRQAQAGPAVGRGKKASGPGNLPGPVKGRVRDKVGEAVGMSGRTYEKAKAVVEAAEEDPETFGPVAEEMDRTGNVDSAFKRVQKVKDPPPPPEPPRFPHSEMLVKWLSVVAGQTHIVSIELGGIRAILGERDKWDWNDVRAYILPQLENLGQTIAEFRGEIGRAAGVAPAGGPPSRRIVYTEGMDFNDPAILPLLPSLTPAEARDLVDQIVEAMIGRHRQRRALMLKIMGMADGPERKELGRQMDEVSGSSPACTARRG
jgi:ParB family chromosome partitioning protein